MKETKTDVLIAGGGLGGCAAALAVAQAGFKVILTEETDWIGGQLTSQAVPPDEHGWIERFGCTKTYRQFRNDVRQFYRKNYPLTEEARNEPFLNPGNGWVAPLCHEPRVALAVIEAMLQPFVSSGKLTILREHRAVSAETTGGKVSIVKIENLRNSDEILVSAEYFLDATELGDLLPMTETEFVTGAESKSETGEPNAKEIAEPNNVQAFSVCFAMSHCENENHTIEKPENYEYWRDFAPNLNPAWTGNFFSWTISHPRTMQPHIYRFAPENESGKAFSGLWTYRRILDRKNFTDGFFDSDVTLVNVPMLDYLGGDICNASDAEKQKHLQAAKQQSLSFLYWMQTEAPREDGGLGFPGLKLRGDTVGNTADGLAKSAYIRESRRIKAKFTILEQHVSEEFRPNQNRAEQFADSIGIGYYRIDLHPSTGGDNYIDVGSLPFQIPLGSLIPERVRNLLPACKNIGTTHITNGCYRLHPIEWNIGEATGTLAAFCLENKTEPHFVYENKTKLADFQKLLVSNGIELEWSPDIVLAEGDPHIHAI